MPARPFRDLLCRFRDAEGNLRICRVAGRPVRDDDGAFSGYRGTATDVTADQESRERIRYLSLHDALTGLPNRVLCVERVGDAIVGARRRGGGAALLCLDLDHFKEINDSLGHAAGDALLQTIARRLRRCIGDGDTLARLGGDEFAVVMARAGSAEEVTELCRRLLATVAAAVTVDAAEVALGTSIGVVMLPDDAATPDEALRFADLALYRAKAAGRNAYCLYATEMNEALKARRRVEQDLRRALVNRELFLAFQPKFAATTLEVTGVEALLRWRHPERGVIPPGEFIGIAEEAGIIVPIGEWVLAEACRAASTWPGIVISVNLSPVQFRQADLVGFVERALKDSGLERGRLELEVTEGVLLKDTGAALRTMRQLKRLGVLLAMDDFGTGYSSLSYLQTFPFERIKIDQSFVRRLATSAEAEAIVRAIIGLGRGLGLAVTAEGVETAEQLVFLRAEGCDEIQGYLMSRPVGPEAISELLAGRPAAPPGVPARARVPA